MDPNATVRRILDALPGDIEEFVEACCDLAGWIMTGGFLPTNLADIEEKHLLLLHLHNRDAAAVLRRAKDGARV